MQLINITAEQLGRLIADEYRSWLTTAEDHELVDAAANLKLGVSLEWVNADDAGTADNLLIYIITTSGTREFPHRSDDAPDFAGYLPYWPLVGITNSDEDIDDVLQEWGVELPAEEDEEVEEDDPTVRIDRFTTLIWDTPALWPQVRTSLANRIDGDVLSYFEQFASEWLDAEEAKIRDAE